MKKTIKDFDLKNKKVIIRCDFNVPIKEGVIIDDNRIIESLETINYAIEQDAKVILLSHLGRIKSEDDKINNSLEPVAQRLGELLKKEIIFSRQTRGKKLETLIDKLNVGDVLLIENTRFEDYPNKLESSNDSGLASYWASLGEIFINDAFGTSHRKHASNVGIASILPSGVGFLIEKELHEIGETIKKPDRPFTVILGGAKVSDKIGVIENLVNIADYIIIGGGMAFTFLKAEGLEVGKSIVDNESIDFCQYILKNHSKKIILPIDIVCGLEIDPNTMVTTKKINELDVDDIGLDIGNESIHLFNDYLERSKTVIWNGPLGLFEIEKFAMGTREIANKIASINITSIIGGGDTAAAVINMGYKNHFTHISTGGGASLEMLEGKELPGIKIINNK